MKYLIQSSGLPFQHYNKVCQSLKELNYNFIDFGLIEHNITNLENILEDLSEEYVFRGSTRLLTMFQKISSIEDLNPYLNDFQKNNIFLDKLKKGIDYNIDTFDQKIYGQLNLPLLNDKAMYINAKECLSTKYTTDLFIKPSRDLKAFNGGILKKGITVEEFIKNSAYQKIYLEETIVLSELKEIFDEYRFFIINGIVVTGSQYKKMDKLYINSYIPNDILSASKEFASMYKPADIYVMDLAKTNEGIKIIEYNCWNSSGVYECNLNKLFSEINIFKKA